MFMEAFIPALVIYIAELFHSVGGTQMPKRPIPVGFLIGLLMGDMKTGIIVGTSLEVVYLGVVSVGGFSSAEPGYATAFAVPLVIAHGMSYDAALAIALVAGAVGVLYNQFRNFLHSLFVPMIDSTLAADKGRFASIQCLIVSLSVRMIGAAAVFFGLYAGAEALTNFMNGLPAFFMPAMSAVGKMLPAVGMAILLNFMWNSSLTVYMLMGYMTYAFNKPNMVYMAVIAVFIAYFHYAVTSKQAAAPAAAPSAELNDGEGFFDE